jgi:hypothetical protein
LLGVVSCRLINLWLPMLPALAGLPSVSRLQPVRRGRRRGDGSDYTDDRCSGGSAEAVTAAAFVTSVDEHGEVTMIPAEPRQS